MNEEKNESEYQLVLTSGKTNKEEILFHSPNLLEVELRREQHIRSIREGYVEIRKA